jgi:hypothetical protein
VVPAALKETVTQHALAKQKKDDCQDDYKQELSNSERGWPMPATDTVNGPSTGVWISTVLTTGVGSDVVAATPAPMTMTSGVVNMTLCFVDEAF